MLFLERFKDLSFPYYASLHESIKINLSAFLEKLYRIGLIFEIKDIFTKNNSYFRTLL